MMENKIKEILQPGETVKWSGRPQNVKLMEAPYGVSFILRVVCAVLLVAVALWFNGPRRRREYGAHAGNGVSGGLCGYCSVSGSGSHLCDE